MQTQLDPSHTPKVLDIAPVTGTIGAEISGVDLSGDLADDTIRALTEALVTHKVLFFRDQAMTSEQQLALGRRFGPLEVHELYLEKTVGVESVDDHPELLVLESKAGKRVAAERWHSDVTFRVAPSLGSILRCTVCPAVGGDTLWADMSAIYDDLDAATQSHLSGLVAIHDWHSIRQKMRKDGVTEDRIAAREAEFPPVEHPVVRTHPVSGRKLIYVNPIFTAKIKGMSETESDALLARLFALTYRSQYQVRFRWRKNSVAFWDNRITQHQVVADFGDQHRRMERVTIAGDRPF